MTPWLSFFDESLCVPLAQSRERRWVWNRLGNKWTTRESQAPSRDRPLLFLAALLLGLASERLLPWPFAVPGTDPVYWMSDEAAHPRAGDERHSRLDPQSHAREERYLETKFGAPATVPTGSPCVGGSERTSGLESREP